MLDRSLTYHLASIAEDGIGNATRIFESRFGLNVYEIRVLRLIQDTPGITFTQLAAMTKFERSATSRMLSRLIKAGLVARENSPRDARQFTLTMTDKGANLCAGADPLSLELEGMMLEPLSDAQREAFRSMLATVLAWVREGYAEKVADRFPEAKGIKAKRSRSREDMAAVIEMIDV